MASSHVNRKVWDGNITPWWLLGSIYLIYFVIYLGFFRFGSQYAGFILHTLIAFVFILACAWNLFHTPSHGELYKRLHVIIGRIAMLSGTFVIISGYIIVLSGKSTLSTIAQNTFMITGAFQLIMQVLMVYFIRIQKNILFHLISACILFFCCALAPALNRMPQVFGFDDSDEWIFVSMSIVFVLTFFAIGHYRWKMKL